MKRLSVSLAAAASSLLFASMASAQVHITEVYYDSTLGSDAGEFVELQNTGTAAEVITGWTLNDYTGSSPTGVSSTTWAFPTVTLAPGQVIIIARSATDFAVEFPGSTADYEYPTAGNDNATVPNLTPMGGTTQMQMANTSDAVVLTNAGVQQSWAEWGNVDRNLPGTPTADVPAGTSLLRVGTVGDSISDFVGGTPNPGVGIMAQPPTIASPERGPAAAVFNGPLNIVATITDGDGVAGAEVYFATSQSLTGPAAANYVAFTAVASGNDYSVSTNIPAVATGITFAEPTLFNERYIRYFYFALDNGANGSELPAGALTTAANPDFFWENVLPATAVYTIAQARAQDANEVPLFEHHSVRVQGVVLTDTEAFQTGRTNFYIADQNGLDAIRIFDDEVLTAGVSPGDLVEVVGKIGVFRGVRQIGRDERGVEAPVVVGPEITVTNMGTATIPMATETVATLLANGEARESQLIEIPNVSLVADPGNGDPPPATWPSEDNVFVSDGTGTLSVRVVGATNVPGNATPVGTFTIRGILAQFAPGGTGGYQLQPRAITDIVGAPGPDGGVVDMGPGPDMGPVVDGGDMDAGPQPDMGPLPDMGPVPDMGPLPDMGPMVDMGPGPDMGPVVDMGPAADTGPRPDAGPGADTGPRVDAGPAADTGPRVDAGRDDGGTFGGGVPEDEGCSCSASATETAGSLWFFALLMLPLLRRRRR